MKGHAEGAIHRDNLCKGAAQSDIICSAWVAKCLCIKLHATMSQPQDQAAMATPAIGTLPASIGHAWSLNRAARDFPLDALIDFEMMAVSDNIDRKSS